MEQTLSTNRRHDELEQLKSCTDITSLRSALSSMCSRFGSISRLDILASNRAGRHQALCFLRMDEPEQEHLLMRELGVGRFGGDLVLVVDLHEPMMGRPH